MMIDHQVTRILDVSVEIKTISSWTEIENAGSVCKGGSVAREFGSVVEFSGLNR